VEERDNLRKGYTLSDIAPCSAAQQQRIAELEMESESRRHLVTGEDIEKAMDAKDKRIAKLESQLASCTKSNARGEANEHQMHQRIAELEGDKPSGTQ
jgi:NOL1/NOP2/fmu family ribosome biogenesis protein